MKQCDVFIIGSGEGGEVPAMECAKSGMHVIMAEQSELGGTCALRGCNPKRALASSAELVIRSRAMAQHGVYGELTLNWSALHSFRKSLIDDISETMRQRLAKSNIELLQGTCRFLSTDTVRVGDTTVSAKNIVVATGSTPRRLNIEGENLITSTDSLLESSTIPASVIFIGAGYISVEFATILSMAGVQTKLLEAMDKPLGGFDADLVALGSKAWEKYGLNIQTGVTVESITRNNDILVVRDSRGANHTAGMVVHGAGRVPNIERLNLPAAGVKTHKGKPVINEFLQSRDNPRVFFAGDAAAAGPQLTPVAEIDGHVVAKNIISGLSVQPDYSSVASCLFTVPEIAGVGHIDDNRLQKKDIEIYSEDTSQSHSTRRIGLTHSGFKALVHRESHTLVGMHILGHNADEAINLFSLAIREKTPIPVLKRMGTTFPSVVYDIIMRL